MKYAWLLLTALICTAITSDDVSAGNAYFSLNLDFNDPTDFSSGGTWTAVAKVDEFGLAGASLLLSDTSFDEVTGFLSPSDYEIQVTSDFGGIVLNVGIGDDLISGTHLLGIGVIGSGWPSVYVDDPNLVPFGVNPDLGVFTGGVSLATGTFAPGLVPDWAIDLPNQGDMTAANLFGEFGDALAADTFLTVRYIDVPVNAPGDANGDGKVDGLDYLFWAGNYGDDPADDPPGSPGNGDFNNDGTVDGHDYLVWAGNYGQGPNDGIAVPEPGTLALATIALLAMCCRRRKRG